MSYFTGALKTLQTLASVPAPTTVAAAPTPPARRVPPKPLRSLTDIDLRGGRNHCDDVSCAVLSWALDFFILTPTAISLFRSLRFVVPTASPRSRMRTSRSRRGVSRLGNMNTLHRYQQPAPLFSADRVRDGAHFAPIDGVSGGQYRPCLDDVGSRILCRVREVTNPANSGFGELGPLIVEGDISARALRLADERGVLAAEALFSGDGVANWRAVSISMGASAVRVDLAPVLQAPQQQLEEPETTGQEPSGALPADGIGSARPEDARVVAFVASSHFSTARILLSPRLPVELSLTFEVATAAAEEHSVAAHTADDSSSASVSLVSDAPPPAAEISGQAVTADHPTDAVESAAPAATAAPPSADEPSHAVEPSSESSQACAPQPSSIANASEEATCPPGEQDEAASKVAGVEAPAATAAAPEASATPLPRTVVRLRFESAAARDVAALALRRTLGLDLYGRVEPLDAVPFAVGSAATAGSVELAPGSPLRSNSGAPAAFLLRAGSSASIVSTSSAPLPSGALDSLDELGPPATFRDAEVSSSVGSPVIASMPMAQPPACADGVEDATGQDSPSIPPTLDLPAPVDLNADVDCNDTQAVSQDRLNTVAAPEGGSESPAGAPSQGAAAHADVGIVVTPDESTNTVAAPPVGDSAAAFAVAVTAPDSADVAAAAAAAVSAAAITSSLRAELRAALAARDKHVAQISELQRAGGAAQARLSALSTALASRDAALARAQQDAHAALSRCDVATASAHAKTVEIKRLSTQVTALTAETQANKQLLQMSEQLEAAKAALTTAKADAAASGSLVPKLQHELRTLSANFVTVRGERDAARADAKDAHDKLEALRGELSTKARAAVKAQSEVEALRPRVEKLEAERDALQAELREAAVARNEARAVAAAAEAAATQAQLSRDAIDKEITAVRVERDDLRAALHVASTRSAADAADVRAVREHGEAANARAMSAVAELEATRTRLQEQAKAVETLAREKADALGRAAALEAELGDARSRTTTAESKLKRLTTAVDASKTLQAQVTALQEQLDTVTSERNAAVKKAESLRRDVSRMTASSDELKSLDIPELVRAKKSLEEKVVRMTAEALELRERLEQQAQAPALPPPPAGGGPGVGPSRAVAASGASPVTGISSSPYASGASGGWGGAPAGRPAGTPSAAASSGGGGGGDDSTRVRELQRLANSLLEQLSDSADALQQQRATKEALARRIHELEDQLRRHVA